MAKESMVGALAHGGALEKAIAEYGGAHDDWLDLSTGINPNAAPIPNIDILSYARLPETEQYEATLSVARAYYSAAGAGLLAAGTQAIIQQIPALIGSQKTQILGPTYGEYARILSQANVPFEHVSDIAQFDAPWCFVVNPDNPSGRIISVGHLTELSKRCALLGGCLVVDEAFVDVDPSKSIAAHASRDGLLVLRSFGKFFGLAGIRLSSAFGPEAIIDFIKAGIGPWPVSGPTLAIGKKLYADSALHQDLRQSIQIANDQTKAALASHGFEIFGDGGLFLTIKHAQAHDLHEALKKLHVLTRIFDYERSWIRFGLCKNEQEVNQLIQCLNVLNQEFDI